MIRICNRLLMPYGLAMACSLLGLVGCKSDAVPAVDIATQTQTLEDAAAKLAARDFSGAKEAATAALQGTGLSADQAGDAILILIESAIETGDLETAEKNLAEAEISSTDMGRVYVLRGLLCRKRGEESKAQEAFQQAKAHDPNVVIPR
ncbi:MAG: hypothetical protein ACK553_11245 [Planctomycetota bacterium]|jgi:Flp pilus assembly protein TadD